MRLVAAVLILSSAAAAAVPAPPPPPVWNPAARENGQLAPAFTFATIAPVLKAIGASYQRSDAEPGRQALRVTFRNGRVAILTLSSCEQRGCKALSIQSFWKPSTPLPADPLAAAIEKFNQRYAFAKAYVTADGRPSLQRYLTADYGFIRGDLAVNLLVFSDQAERFAVDYLEPLAKAGK